MKPLPPRPASRAAAFTMVEIALCLAIIGFALVALIGILPAALNVQKENRQDTTINNDAAVWLDALRSGAKVFPVLDYERNVFALTNWTTEYDPITGNLTKPTHPRGLDAANMNSDVVLGFLSTPRLYLKGNTLYSNHVVAYVRAFTAPVVNLPPQVNTTILDSAFSYILTATITPHASASVGPTTPQATNFVNNLAANLWEVQLRLEYPLLPGGKAVRSRTYRATVSGQLQPYRLDWPAPAATGTWTADLYSFRPGTYLRPQP